ncbi:MAG: TadA family conjugal transfer-associated ATPase [Peptidiphaga gingivicola]
MTSAFERAGRGRASEGEGTEAEAMRRVRASLARGGSDGGAIAMLDPAAVSARDVVGLGRRLRQAIAGAGPLLDPLLSDRSVTDVLVNGGRGVWVDRGNGMERDERASRGLSDNSSVRALAVRLAAACGQRLDDSSPIVDGTFPDGLRLHAVLPPLAAEGTLISMRAHRPVSFTLAELAEGGMFDRFALRLLLALVAHRANVIVSGATGSGKTTLLAAVLGEVPSDERILVIEESAELRPSHPHVVHLQVRRANVQGAGEVALSELVRAAMRMRPDRIVLGECRGAEVREVLTALNTGHEGGWATIHANSAADVPARLTALGALAGMSEDVVAAQAASALDAVVHIERRDGVRVLTQVAVLERRRGELTASVALEFEGKAVAQGPAWPRLAARVGMNARTGAEACAASDARIGAEVDVGVGAGTGTDVGIGSAASIGAGAAGGMDGRTRTGPRSGVHRRSGVGRNDMGARKRDERSPM